MADHQGDMAGGREGAVGAGEEHEITWAGVADVAQPGPLRLRRARDGDASRGVGLHHQPGAVEGVRAGAAPDVGLAELRLRVGDGLPGSRAVRGRGSSAGVRDSAGVCDGGRAVGGPREDHAHDNGDSGLTPGAQAPAVTPAVPAAHDRRPSRGAGTGGASIRHQVTRPPSAGSVPHPAATAATMRSPRPCSSGGRPARAGRPRAPPSRTRISTPPGTAWTVTANLPPGSPDLVWATALVASSDTHSAAAAAAGWPAPSDRRTICRAARTDSGTPGSTTLRAPRLASAAAVMAGSRRRTHCRSRL